MSFGQRIIRFVINSMLLEKAQDSFRFLFLFFCRKAKILKYVYFKIIFINTIALFSLAGLFFDIS